MLWKPNIIKTKGLLPKKQAARIKNLNSLYHRKGGLANGS